MVRRICRALPGATEDIKWGSDLAPHTIAFKCTAEDFAELVERDGIIPAPYLARAMWVQEREPGAALERRELECLIKSSYELVAAKLPKSRRPGAIRGAPRRPRKKAKHLSSFISRLAAG